MSKFTEQLRGIGIYNPHGFAVTGTVFIDYYPNENGRGGRGARWVVDAVGFKVDPNAPWYAMGRKEFSILGRGTHAEVKAHQLEETKNWASEKYGIKEWERTPFGTFMDAEFVKTRMAELKKQLADASPDAELEPEPST